MVNIWQTDKNLPNPGQAKPLIPVWLSVILYLVSSFVLAVIFVFLLVPLSKSIPKTSAYNEAGQMFISYLATLLGNLLSAIFFLRVVDKRPLSELGLGIRGRGKDILLGFALGAVLIGLGFGISLLLRAQHIVSVQFNPGMLIASFLIFLVAALMEEVMIRGYVLGRLMSRLNRFAALALSSVIFALMHSFNPNLGVLPMINLFLAGIMLGAAFVYTRNLWFPTALHVAWNWIEGSILGYEVSGTSMFPSLLTVERTGSNLITGGSFGFEGSLLCSILTIAASLAIIAWGERRKKKVNEWERKK